MPLKFIPTDVVDMSKERDWPAGLGMLDWDNTSIVFTKRTLIEFLKYTGTTVDTNFYNINKLPKYVKFGKLVEEKDDEGKDTSEPTGTGDEFRSPRRVREVPGGPHSDIFTHEEDDALAAAPPRPKGQVETPAASVEQPAASLEHEGIDFGKSSFKPTRRVRENPGGTSSLSSFWGEPQEDEFKPTRRVRERPGGKDSISDLF